MLWMAYLRGKWPPPEWVGKCPGEFLWGCYTFAGAERYALICKNVGSSIVLFITLKADLKVHSHYRDS